ncbi:hypothetical protein DQ244_04715 [Blastococcus sp. TBT05-19]|uniref:hypothetical protein n=1 Tax=Blastococcus sp. TBT05-19 TaxID=2250581 RepID=UPI000DE9C80D|nr:hypothetical protein [Blastococcus sp. TBT05-19]RBY94598.1 hypothetical protein DQ244_04715 [Blastococcus sp. TBT05-19]
MNASEDPTPDTAMASGPGGRLGPGDLAPDEERLLAALERDARSGGPTLQGTTAVVPAPDGAGPPDDGLTPTFTAPGGD